MTSGFWVSLNFVGEILTQFGLFQETDFPVFGLYDFSFVDFCQFGEKLDYLILGAAVCAHTGENCFCFGGSGLAADFQFGDPLAIFF